MRSNLVKIKEKKLQKAELTGNFLYEKKGKYFFNKSMVNSMFKPSAELQGEEGLFTFSEYLTQFLHVCQTVANKPSLVFVNTKALKLEKETLEGYQTLEITAKTKTQSIKKLNQDSCVAYMEDMDLAKQLMVDVAGRAYEPGQRPIIIVFNQPEKVKDLNTMEYKKLKEFNLDVLSTISRGHGVYFIFNVLDLNKLSQVLGAPKAACVEENCLLSYLCNDGKVVHIKTFSNTKFL